MLKLNFRVNYNVTLLNFVDSLSKWDYFVGDHLKKYFSEQYGFESAYESILIKYAELRKPLGWQNEIELFNWAYAGFLDHSEFSPLKETLHYSYNTLNKRKIKMV